MLVCGKDVILADFELEWIKIANPFTLEKNCVGYRPMNWVFYLAVAFGLSGCINQMIIDGTISSTREASSAFDTLSDLEVARSGAAASIAQLEGMQKLSPDNEDALFLLTQSWVGFGGAFIEDQWEQAVDRDDEAAEAYQGERARLAYERALRFGTQLLEQRHRDFKAAQKNYQTITAYLKQFDAEDAESLLWVGAAWLSRGGVAGERPEVVAELFVGVALLERSVELNDKLGWGLGYAALGAYHARAPDAELAQAKVLFEKALTQTYRKVLTIQLMYAQSYACNAHDEKLYGRLLNEVLAAGDPLAEQRIENVVAQRKAGRYLDAPRLRRCGFGVTSR
jgi:hypothetical protein